MTSEPQKASLKEQRDKFLTFCFAAADLLLEVDCETDIIMSTLGGSRLLTGLDEKTLLTKKWSDIFTLSDQAYLKECVKSSTQGKRAGPFYVTLENNNQRALFSSIQLPKSDIFYVTVTLANDFADMIASQDMEETVTALPSADELRSEMSEKISSLSEIGKPPHLSLLDIKGTHALKDRITDEDWQSIQQGIFSSLQQNSIDGDMAGKISDTRYSILHDSSLTLDDLHKQIADLAMKKDPDGDGLYFRHQTIETDASEMNEKDIAHSLLYAIDSFKRKGVNHDVSTLKQGLDTYIESNKEKIEDLKGFIKSKSFEIYFQPIVDLKTNDLHHYECLSRFTHGNTQEWVVLAEDTGLIIDLDLAVIDKVLNYIKYKAGTTSAQFSANISGQSICDESFMAKLSDMLAKHSDIHKRLSFEVTESYHINNLDKAQEHINTLREKGFVIALDDFGAGSASFDYLHSLKVDIVKIDGKFIKNIRSSQRDLAIVKSISNMCKDLGYEVVAEFVEDAEQVKTLKKLGVNYGQGYLYSRPRPSPDYINKSAASG